MQYPVVMLLMLMAIMLFGGGVQVTMRWKWWR